MIELYDVGRVITGPFNEGYRFIAEQGDRYIQNKDALEEIRAFHRDRSREISQFAFNFLNKAWTEAIRSKELIVKPSELVYRDVKPRFDKVRAAGNKVFLHTSGSKELVDYLLEGECTYDRALFGEDTGDKNDPETFAKIQDLLEGQVSVFYDDKPRVLNAAYEGFRLAGGKVRLYLVDRRDKVPLEKVAELGDKGILKINSFGELK